MKKIINVYKPLGKTPLEAVREFKKKFPEYSDLKIAYAGRLDPMAEGVLLLLIEPETKKRSKYQNLDKKYSFDVLFSVKTDTGDILGLSQNKKLTKMKTINKDQLIGVTSSFEGLHTQKYPLYSSKTVQGKPLFWWARNNKINEIAIPEKEVTIYKLNLVELKRLKTSQIKKKIFKNIDLVKGDFRQREIKKAWTTFFQNTGVNHFQVATLDVHCSSGTYIRTLASSIGKKLGIPSLAYSIKRTAVGSHSINGSLVIVE